jgi:hypothetical protein
MVLLHGPKRAPLRRSRSNLAHAMTLENEHVRIEARDRIDARVADGAGSLRS